MPNEALRLFMKHVLELQQGLFCAEIKGALAGMNAERCSMDKFHIASEVEVRVAKPFRIAFDSYVGATQPATPEAAQESAASAQTP